MYNMLYNMFLPIADFIGMIGVISILIAYLFLSLGRWSANTCRFQLLNCVGASLILFSLFFHWNLSSVVIETAWIIISIMGIFRVLHMKKKREHKM